MRTVIGVILLLAGLVGGFFSVASILWQQRAMTNFIEVPVTVTETSIRDERNKNSHTYYPVIRYRYDYKGAPYASTQVFPYESGDSDRSWAEGIIARYPPAIQALGIERGLDKPNAKAYIDPENPSDAILIREYFFNPYAFAMGSLYAALCGLGLLVTDAFSSGREKMAAVALDDSGWQLLLPKQSLKRRMRNTLIWFMGVSVILFPLLAHWLIVVGHLTTGFVIGMIMGGVMWIILAVTLARRWSVSRHLSDARLRVRPAPLVRGMPFSMELEADAYSPLNVECALAKVVCTEHYKEKRGNKTSIGTRTKSQQEVQLCAPCSTAAGQVLAGKGYVLIQPHEWPPTTDITVKLYPYYTYDVRLMVKLKGMVDYEGIFPLHVE